MAILQVELRWEGEFDKITLERHNFDMGEGRANKAMNAQTAAEMAESVVVAFERAIGMERSAA